MFYKIAVLLLVPSSTAFAAELRGAHRGRRAQVDIPPGYACINDHVDSSSSIGIDTGCSDDAKICVDSGGFQPSVGSPGSYCAFCINTEEETSETDLGCFEDEAPRCVLEDLMDPEVGMLGTTCVSASEAVPTQGPTAKPSNAPSSLPSSFPSMLPSLLPSIFPSTSPSNVPSLLPSDNPSMMPSLHPSTVPSEGPSPVPSLLPSSFPSMSPSVLPSELPSANPSNAPSLLPSDNPSTSPSLHPSTHPSQVPTGAPTQVPSPAPTITNNQWYVTDWGQSCDSQCRSVGRTCNEEAMNLVDNGARARFVGEEALGLTCPSTANSGSNAAPGISVGCLFSWHATHATCYARTGSIRRFCCCSEDPEDCPVEDGATRTPSDAPSTSPVPSEMPSEMPSSVPSAIPSEMPSEKPSSVPSAVPSEIPSKKPSIAPSAIPTSTPTISSQWYLADWGQSCRNRCQAVGGTCNAGLMDLVDDDSRVRFVGEEALGLTCPFTASSGSNSAPGISVGCQYSWQGTNVNCYGQNPSIRRFCCCSDNPEDCPFEEVPSAAPSSLPSPLPTPQPSGKPSVQPGWSLGPYGSNCQSHCQSLGEEATCNDEALQSINSRDKSVFVAEQALGLTCDRVAVSRHIETPGISMVSTCLRPRFTVPTCNDAGSDWVRPFCCCSANGEDCPVE